jgi:hypothetical protein
MFYRYRQNNSGGGFMVDKDRGVGHTVFIEAVDSTEASRKAQEIGIYFDGVDNGDDCECCGDRWMDYPDAIAVISKQDLPKSYFNDQYFIHYADGTIEHIDAGRDDGKSI